MTTDRDPRTGEEPPPPRAVPAFHAATSLWITLIVATAIKAIAVPRKHTIYPLLVGGPRDWWAGIDLYDVHSSLFDIYRYSPTWAILFTPLGLLPDRLGGALWALLNLGLLAFALVVAAKDFLPGRWDASRLGWLGVLVAFGSIRSAWNAQSNPLVIALMLLGASAIARKRWWSASVLLALPVFMKLSPVVVAMLFVALWPKKLLPRFLAVMAIGALLPFLTAPPAYVFGQYQHWITGLSASSATRWPAFRDAWTLWELTGHTLHLPAYRMLQVGAGLAILGWCLRLRGDSREDRAALTATLAMGAAYLMVFGPAVEYPTYAVLSPMVAWSVVCAFERRTGRAWAVAAYALTVVVGSEAVEGPLLAWTPIARAALPAGTLIFAGWLVRYVPDLLADGAAVPVAARRVTFSPRLRGRIIAGR